MTASAIVVDLLPPPPPSAAPPGRPADPADPSAGASFQTVLREMAQPTDDSGDDPTPGHSSPPAPGATAPVNGEHPPSMVGSKPELDGAVAAPHAPVGVAAKPVEPPQDAVAMAPVDVPLDAVAVDEPAEPHDVDAVATVDGKAVVAPVAIVPADADPTVVVAAGGGRPPPPRRADPPVSRPPAGPVAGPVGGSSGGASPPPSAIARAGSAAHVAVEASIASPDRGALVGDASARTPEATTVPPGASSATSAEQLPGTADPDSARGRPAAAAAGASDQGALIGDASARTPGATTVPRDTPAATSAEQLPGIAIPGSARGRRAAAAAGPPPAPSRSLAAPVAPVTPPGPAVPPPDMAAAGPAGPVRPDVGTTAPASTDRPAGSTRPPATAPAPTSWAPAPGAPAAEFPAVPAGPRGIAGRVDGAVALASRAPDVATAAGAPPPAAAGDGPARPGVAKVDRVEQPEGSNGAVGRPGPSPATPPPELADSRPSLAAPTAADGRDAPAGARATLDAAAAAEQLRRAEVRRLAGVSQMIVEVDTEQLGQVRIDASARAGDLHMHLSADDAGGRAALGERLSELRADLRDAGLGQARVDVGGDRARQDHAARAAPGRHRTTDRNAVGPAPADQAAMSPRTADGRVDLRL